MKKLVVKIGLSSLIFLLAIFVLFGSKNNSSPQGNFAFANVGIGDTGPTPTIGIGETTPTPTIIITNTPTPTSTPTPTPTPDITDPTVTITYPLNGTKIPKNTTINITANASDNVGVDRVEFFVNNILKCTDTTAPYSCSYFVVPKPQTYTIRATAYDLSGNSASNTSVVTSK